jgi:hypothetical protein
MEKYAGPIVGVVIVALVGLGLYTMQVRGELAKAKMASAAAAQQVATLQKQATDAATKSAIAQGDFEKCTVDLKTAQDELAAVPKKGAVKR